MENLGIFCNECGKEFSANERIFETRYINKYTNIELYKILCEKCSKKFNKKIYKMCFYKKYTIKTTELIKSDPVRDIENYINAIREKY